MSGLKVYGTGWCPDCRVVGKLLGEHRIPYTWIDVETDRTGLTFIEQVAGKQAVPIVALEDGTVLVQPSRDQLARRLNLPAKARCRFADLVILAMGSSYKRLGVPGEERFIGRGVHFCATCDGPFYEGEELAVVGGGNSAVEEGLFLTRFAAKVTLLVRGGELKASRILVEKIRNHPKVQVRYRTAVEEFRGDGKFDGIRVRHLDTGAAEEITPGGVFVFIGMEPNTQFLKGTIDLDQWGFVRTAPSLESSLKGVFACGDVRAGSTKQVASAAGEGATAALMVREYLKGFV